MHTPQRPGHVAGKVAFITGGAGGIGQAIALRLGQEGARTVLSDLDPVAGQAAVQARQAQGLRAMKEHGGVIVNIVNIGSVSVRYRPTSARQAAPLMAAARAVCGR